MIKLLIYALAGAAVAALAGYLLAGGLPEGAIAGAVFGGSIGFLIAMRRASGAAGPAFEYEAAGLHDDNLTTIARRNLVRDAYRESYQQAGYDAESKG